MDALTLTGTLSSGGACGAQVGGCGTSGDVCSNVLALRCSPMNYQGAVATRSALQVQTPGVPGSSFVDLDVLGDLTGIELLYVKTDAPFVLRIGAAEPVITGSGGTFPTLFAGGETLVVEFDGLSVTTTFLVGDQTAAQCVARINAACALAGLATPRAAVTTSGQIEITGVGTGADSTLDVTGGTGAATLGLAAASAIGAGADVPVYGTFLAEFGVAGGVPAVPERVQFSGSGRLTLTAAGRTT